MKDPKYDSLSHAKYRIRYHFIFSTKYRKNLLIGEISDKVKSYMQSISENNKQWSIEVMEIDPSKPNHIHILIKSNPNIAPYQIVHDLKQYSTYMCWKENNSYMRKWYWSGKHYLWTRGYFCSTIGDASIKTIYNYIENQG